MSLYTDLIDAKVETSQWQSDLYFEWTEISKEILSKYPNQTGGLFKNQVNGKMWYCANFAYDPYWPHGRI